MASDSDRLEHDGGRIWGRPRHDERGRTLRVTGARDGRGRRRAVAESSLPRPLAPSHRFRVPEQAIAVGPLKVLRRGLEADRLRYACRVDQGEDGEDDMLGKRSPSRAKSCEPRVNRCQLVPIGA